MESNSTTEGEAREVHPGLAQRLEEAGEVLRVPLERAVLEVPVITGLALLGSLPPRLVDDEVAAPGQAGGVVRPGEDGLSGAADEDEGRFGGGSRRGKELVAPAGEVGGRGGDGGGDGGGGGGRGGGGSRGGGEGAGGAAEEEESEGGATDCSEQVHDSSE